MADQRLFEASALLHKDAAYNLAFWIVRNPADAEDVVQDAYLRAYRAFGGFRDGAPVKPWLLAIVRNVAYRLLQQRRLDANLVPLDTFQNLRGTMHESELASAEPHSEDRLIAQANSEEICAALAALPLAYRDVVVLREMEELSYAEISEIVGVPVGTVMSRLSRGRTLLRQALKSMRKGQ